MSMKARRIISFLLLLIILPCFIRPASAMTPPPPTLIDGSDAEGVFIATDTGAVLKNISITFDLNDLPVIYYSGENEDYTGSVKAEYTVFNPTEDEVTVRMTYPISSIPAYAYGEGGDPSKISITVNGEEADLSLRHVYDSYSYPSRFDSLLSDEYLSNEYVSPDMTVTKYVFRQSDVTEDWAYIGFDVEKGKMPGSCIYLGKLSGAWDHAENMLRFHLPADGNGATYELYAFGDELDSLPNWKFYKDITLRDEEEIEGKMTLVGTESLTLSEYATQHYDESLGISETDWFNMIANDISGTIEYGRDYTSLGCLNEAYKGYIVSGYVYYITLAPGEEATTSVESYIYPSVETAYDPYTYKYNHNLPYEYADIYSGAITVTVNTPYYMIDNHGFDFEKTDSGYSLSFTQIEKAEDNTDVKYGGVWFTLCESENPEEVESDFPILFWIIVIPILIIVAVVYLIIWAVGSLINWIGKQFK